MHNTAHNWIYILQSPNEYTICNMRVQNEMKNTFKLCTDDRIKICPDSRQMIEVYLKTVMLMNNISYHIKKKTFLK